METVSSCSTISSYTSFVKRLRREDQAQAEMDLFLELIRLCAELKDDVMVRRGFLATSL